MNPFTEIRRYFLGSYEGERLTEKESIFILCHKCPDCGKQNSMLEGPQGGMSCNVLCENCKSEFNICPQHLEFPGERIGKNQKERMQFYKDAKKLWSF